MTITETKRCPRCRERRDPSWFSEDRRRRDWKACWCKPCCRRAWREREWKIAEEEFERIIQAQGGGCPICRTKLEVDGPSGGTFSSARVDVMEDGKIRGFLCRECKAGLTGFRGDPDRLRAAVEYLSAFNCD
jgi:hypothetical protein